MSGTHKLTHEFRARAVTIVYFAVWLAVLIILKRLLLAGYQIRVVGLSLALLIAVAGAQVVIATKRALVGAWPSGLELAWRLFVYTAATLLILIVEMAFEDRSEYTGFGPALAKVIQYPDLRQAFANAIWMAVALLGFEVLRALRRRVAKQELPSIETSRPDSEPAVEHTNAPDQTKRS